MEVPDGGGKLEHVEVLEDVGDGHQTQDTQEPQACVHNEGSSCTRRPLRPVYTKRGHSVRQRVH